MPRCTWRSAFGSERAEGACPGGASVELPGGWAGRFARAGWDCPMRQHPEWGAGERSGMGRCVGTGP